MRKIHRDDDIKVSNKESMNQEFNFASKTILVTSGGSGIGRATAILFLQHAPKLFDDDKSLSAIF